MFKRPVLAVTLGLLTTFSALSYANDQQKMMESMLQFQRCFAENINEQDLEVMSKNSEKMAEQLEQLCQAGKRQEAQNSAIKFTQQMLDDPTFKAMQACVAQVDIAFPGMPDLKSEFSLEELKKTHICDEL